MQIDDVTLCGIAWGRQYIDKLFTAFQQFDHKIRFAKTFFFVDEELHLPDRIEIVRLPHYFSLGEQFTLPTVAPISSPKLNPYCYFLMKDLAKYITTSHVLIFQDDGWVANPNAWEADFLEYDYIGAVWRRPEYQNRRVGNGGFSLRSKRLLDAVANDHGIPAAAPEDVQICCYHRTYLESRHNIRFAPEEVANRFSVEYAGAYTGQFGFHGAWHIIKFSRD